MEVIIRTTTAEAVNLTAKLIAEAIRRKPVKREWEGAIHAAGFILLMGLMVLLTYKDIMRFFIKG